jgi:hypothetical protein
MTDDKQPKPKPKPKRVRVPQKRAPKREESYDPEPEAPSRIPREDLKWLI